jgi:hypothetical protein
MEKVDWDFDLSFVPHNVKYVPPEIVDHREWTIDVYKNILGVDIELENTEELNQVINKLNNNTSRQVIYNDLIKLALKENAKNIKVDFNDILDKDDVGKRILFCLPENEIDVFNSTSLLKFIKEEHPDHNIYFATKKEYFDLVLTNPYVHKVLEYNPIMEDTFWGEGALNHKGFFSFVLLPHINTHKFQNYRHSDKHKIPYDLKHA